MKTLILKHSYKGKFIRTYRLHRSNVSIGGARTARIHVLGGKAAGLACLITKEKGQWRILDLGSEPDTKIDHKPFVEATIDSRNTLTVCDNTFEMRVTEEYRGVFHGKYQSAESGQNYYVAKWKGQVVETGYSRDALNEFPSDQVEIREYKFSKRKEIERDSLSVPQDLRKPLVSTFAILAVFFLFLIGFPTTKQEATKPADNVYTRMIFDSKILNDKKKELQSSGTKLLRGSGGTGQQQSAANQKNQAPESKAVTSLRQAGISSIINKIAKQASQNAALMARLAAMPAADASINAQQLNTFGQNAGTQGKAGKADILSGKQGFKLGAIGTAGKGGGQGGYKNGNELGDGGVGHGDIAIDDTESQVEGGLDKEVIAKIIREHLGQIRYCYDRQLASDSELRGKIKVKFSINAGGDVETQSIGETTMNNAMVEECILRRIATWKFPKPRGGVKVLVSYPFLLKSVN